ncbi:tubulin/FtsZ family, GTPase domain-containing protein [Ditylenchus destructor]|nr:tubulin/FtsZ family, GTPase domain-containing protein [Ditylenchus destructor]
MPGSIISIHVGQCGNQIGAEFWKTMCMEHGIGPDGAPSQPHKPGEDRKELFFNEINLGTRFMPRSVLVDLEPRVINQIKSSEYAQLHNHGNMYVSSCGSGAGNNWACGYNQSGEIIEEIFDILDHEAGNADSLEGFVLSHSIAGGTGSGLGSKILESLKDRYPNTILQSCSVFSDTGDVVVGPYNSLLTLDWLIEHPDIVMVLDNQALYKVAIETMRLQTPSLEHINSMVSRIMSASTAPLRFYSPVYTRMAHIAAYMNPYPPMQLVQTAYAPFIPVDNKYVVNTSAEKVLSRLLDPRSLISSASTITSSRSPAIPNQIQHCMLSALAFLQTDASRCQSENAIRRHALRSSTMKFPSWSSSGFNIATCNLSPYMEHPSILQKIIQQYDQLRKRDAFIDRFKQEGVEKVSMDNSREKIAKLVNLYEEATTPEFLEFPDDVSINNISSFSLSRNSSTPATPRGTYRRS